MTKKYTPRNAKLARQLERWYPLRPHAQQLALYNAVSEGVRFPIGLAGRRSGKTEMAKRFLANTANSSPGEMLFAAAPTYTQAKRIWWDDLKALTLSCIHPRRPSESELIIYAPNGSQIHVVGLDRPERIEGSPWTGGVIDEIANTRAGALNENIMPALNTMSPMRPDYRAWCWFIGVPEGNNHYADMVDAAYRTPGWAVYSWPSADILPADVIEAERARMSPRQFRQEYEASFESATGRIYPDYGPDNATDEVQRDTDALMWAHDFNYSPLSSCIAVRRGEQIIIVGEIVLEGAVARQAAHEFVSRYASHANKTVTIYGDPAGRAGEKHSQASNYTEIEQVLRAAGWRVTRKVSPAAPLIKDRQAAVRAMILSASGVIRLRINPRTAPWSHRSLLTTQYLPGSAYQEDQRNQYQHISTAIGYMIHRERDQRGGGIVHGL